MQLDTTSQIFMFVQKCNLPRFNVPCIQIIMHFILPLILLVTFVFALPGWADSTNTVLAKKLTDQTTSLSSDDIEDIESEYIADFELVDVPESPPPDPELEKIVQDDQYSNGRMAFLFGQYQAAYDIWLPLANKGYAKAQATLGWMYHTGKGVEKDMSKAFEWYEKAARQNHPIAQNNLGVFYEQGLSVGRSASKAAKWYREAAEWGYPYAQYNLGTLYLEGRGVKKDNKEAQFWLQIAALQGVEQAVAVLENMAPNSHARNKNGVKPVSVSKSPHDTPHGSKDYKKIYNRIRSSANTMDGLDYGSSLPRERASSKTQSSAVSSDGSNQNKSSSQKSTNSGSERKISKQQSQQKHSSVKASDEKKVTIKEMLPGDKFDKWLADAQVAQARLKQLEKEKMTNSHSLKVFNDEWVKDQNPAFFTLQLARSDELNWLLEIAKKQPMFKDTAYYTTMVDGKKWFYLIYGNFENRKTATDEIERLPKALKKWSPWVRQFSELQSNMMSESSTGKSGK